MGVETSVKSKAEAQALAEFLEKEFHRHLGDMYKILNDQKKLKRKWNVVARGKYVGKWIEP